LSKEYMNKYPA